MKITMAKNLKQKPDFNNLGFGKYYTDHMLIMQFQNGSWLEPEIVACSNLVMPPSTACLHYGQGIFEGAKAYKGYDGKIALFRIDDNLDRMNNSAKRLCMPAIDKETVKKGLIELLKVESSWIPTIPGTSLYIRPTMIGVDPELGVHPSKNYLFYIILSPVGAYYKNGMQPTKIMVESNFVRSAVGGTGEAKCMGNYAASLLAAERASEKGYDQVLWLDARDKKYVEEVGSMNIFFVIDKKAITPRLTGSILPGITRDSAIKILEKYGYKVEERDISIDEIIKAHKSNKLTEVFGTGTAAVISPVGLISYKGEDYEINKGQMGEVTEFLYSKITNIQNRKDKDEFNWVEVIN